jgi:hypothetical protein
MPTNIETKKKIIKNRIFDEGIKKQTSDNNHLLDDEMTMGERERDVGKWCCCLSLRKIK